MTPTPSDEISMRPFEQIRVLDLTHVLAGPFSTFQLACMGADVIKIESQHSPDMTRIEGVDPQQCEKMYGSYFQAQNAGKRSITLNLKTEKGKAALWRLIETADVLVQNYAGDSLESLGFGYDAVQQKNEKLIYCSISGFGRTGPKADHPAYDVVIQAFSGLMAANGERNGDPVRVGPPMVDYGTGAQAAFAIAGALLQRTKTGKGQFIDVSMLDAALMLMSAHVVETNLSGTKPFVHGNGHADYAGYATYDTKDGQIMIGAWTNKQLANAMSVLGEHERAAAILTASRKEVSAVRDADAQIIAKHMESDSADNWEQKFNRAHVPAARVRTLDETLNEEQLKHRMVLQAADGAGEGTPQTFPVTAFSYLHGTPRVSSAPPKLGEHTHEVLMEAGMSADEIQALQDDGAA